MASIDDRKRLILSNTESSSTGRPITLRRNSRLWGCLEVSAVFYFRSRKVLMNDFCQIFTNAFNGSKFINAYLFQTPYASESF